MACTRCQETGHKIYTACISKKFASIAGNNSRARHIIPAAFEKQHWADAGMVSIKKRGRFSGNWGITDSVTRGREYYQLLKQVLFNGIKRCQPNGAEISKARRFGLADIMGPGAVLPIENVKDR